MKRLKQPSARMLILWLLIAVVLIWGLSGAVAKAQEQYKPIIPFSKTSWSIEPYYEFKPTVAAFTVKAKDRDYCPFESSDYQCPADYDPIDHIADVRKMVAKVKEGTK